MSKIANALTVSFPLALACLFNTGAAWAELGGSIHPQAVLIHAQSSVVATTRLLSVYQVTTASGTQVKEYTNADNAVVAVSWQGPTLPNLKELLGPYFQPFADRPKTGTPVNHHSAELNSEDLVVQSQGRMRSFSGRAYLPKLLPAGFNLDQIK